MGQLARGAAGVLLVFVLSSAAHAQGVLVDVGEDWSYFKGTVAPPADWNSPDFDDSGWLVGPTGIGYGDTDDATVLSDMQNTYPSVFFRKSFDATDAGDVESLVLRIDYDDGFVAYLNGEEATRSMLGTVGVPVAYNTLATSHEAGTPEVFSIDPALLEEGENVLAVEVHNTTLGSSDLSFIPELLTDPRFCPRALSCVLNLADQSVALTWDNNTGTFEEIEILRNGQPIGTLFASETTFTDPTPDIGENVYSVVAIQDGEECPALECTVTVVDPSDIIIDVGEEWAFFRGVTAPPVDWNSLDFDDGDWEFGFTGIGYGDGDDATILDDMRQIAGVQEGYLTVFTRFVFRLPASLDGIAGLNLQVTYDDGYVAYLNGQEVGRVNMPDAPAPVDYLTTAVAAIASGDPSEIQIPRTVLRPGDNAIAVSVHNVNLTSSDLTFIPLLLKVRGDTGGDLLFRRGDVTSDGTLNLADGLNLLNFLFLNGPTPTCTDAADLDDNGNLNLADALVLLNNLFLNGPPPAAPGLTCGPDPSTDGLGDCSTAGC